MDRILVTLALLISATCTACGGGDTSAGESGGAGGSSGAGGGGGAPMVSIDGRFEIDAREVSQADYAAFLAAHPTESTPVHDRCQTMTDNTPTINWPPTGDGTLPVTGVNWCNAYAYCAWAGKRLCGRIDGGPLAATALSNPAESAWYRACAGSDGQAYPYGPTKDPERCNGPDNSTNDNLPWDATHTSCESSLYPGLFDMSGNLAEWEDNCDVQAGVPEYMDNCTQRGGSFGILSLGTLACDDDSTVMTRSSASSDAGFRCCR